MSRESPQAAFEHARDALRRLDWPEFFACLDVGDLKRVAENAVSLSLGTLIDDAAAEVRAICHAHGFPLDDLLRARRRIMDSPGMEATRDHRDTMKRGLAAVKNLPGFLAGLEGHSAARPAAAR